MRRRAPRRSAGAVLLALLFAAGIAEAQTRGFNCVGAEELEDDVFAVPFRPGSAQVTDAARSALLAAAERIAAEPARNVCVLGHADREGGQTANVRLAAARARAVSQALASRHAVEGARLRAEARVAGFSRRTGNPVERSVTVVVLPLRTAPPPAIRPDAARRPAAPSAPWATPFTGDAPAPAEVPATSAKP